MIIFRLIRRAAFEACRPTWKQSPCISSNSSKNFTTSSSVATLMRFPMPKSSHVKGSVTVYEESLEPKLDPLQRVDPNDKNLQSQLFLDGHPMSADPGGSRWSAPYYLPGRDLQYGVPRALLSDPWPSAEDIQTRKEHAASLVSLLRSAPAPMTAHQIFQAANEASSVEGVQMPTFGSLKYVCGLLEHLRTARMIRGTNNPDETKIGPGAQGYPLLYYAPKYQQEEYGSLASIKSRQRNQKRTDIEQALKRLRRRKSPYRLHRRQAHESALSYELGRVEVAKHLQSCGLL